MSGFPRKKRRNAEPVAHALADMFKRRKLDDLARFVLINGAWVATVGTELAKHIQPAKVTRGTLFVTVRHSAYNTELQFLAPTLLKKLNAVLGDGSLLQLRVWAGAAFKQPPPPPPKRSLAPRENQYIASTGACIEDPDVRAAFVRLMGKWMVNEDPTTS